MSVRLSVFLSFCGSVAVKSVGRVGILMLMVVTLYISHITLVAHTIYESYTSFLTHIMLVRLVILF